MLAESRRLVAVGVRSRMVCTLSESVLSVSGLFRRTVGRHNRESVYLAYIYIYSIFRDEAGIRPFVAWCVICTRGIRSLVGGSFNQSGIQVVESSGSFNRESRLVGRLSVRCPFIHSFGIRSLVRWSFNGQESVRSSFVRESRPFGQKKGRKGKIPVRPHNMQKCGMP